MGTASARSPAEAPEAAEQGSVTGAHVRLVTEAVGTPLCAFYARPALDTVALLPACPMRIVSSTPLSARRGPGRAPLRAARPWPSGGLGGDSRGTLRQPRSDAPLQGPEPALASTSGRGLSCSVSLGARGGRSEGHEATTLTRTAWATFLDHSVPRFPHLQRKGDDSSFSTRIL